jgi:hypothetical protein
MRLATTKDAAGCSEVENEGEHLDADIAAFEAVWPRLLEPIRAAILALVRIAAAELR